MKFIDLVDKRLIGYMDLKDQQKYLSEQFRKYNVNDYPGYIGIALFLGKNILKCRRVLLVSDNKEGEYHWYSNWRLLELPDEIPLEIDSNYKSIGERIGRVCADCALDYVLHSDNIEAEMDRWIAAVGEGYWNAKEGENYFFIWIETRTKTLSLGTVYYDCHYPDTIWEFI